MFFYNQVLRLAREFFKFKKYKTLHPVIAIFTGIFLLPFAALFIVELGVLFIFTILFSFIEAPTKYLHNILSEEGQKVQHATQFIIYFISWPLIFLCYALYAAFTLLIVVYYFICQTLGYVASLGGYKFHASPYEENIEKEVNGKYNIQAAIFIGVHALIVLIALITAIVIFAELYKYYREAEFGFRLIRILILSEDVGGLFSIVYVPIAFKDIIKEEKNEENKAETSK